MSDTPRTDLSAFDACSSTGESWVEFTDHPHGDYVTSDFARKLERELAEMTNRFHKADGLRIAAEGLRETAERELAEMTKERDFLLTACESDSIICSCNCGTKTPEANHHKRGCKYRLIIERDKWADIAAQYSQEREHNANMAMAYKAERDKLKQEEAKALECVTNECPSMDEFVNLVPTVQWLLQMWRECRKFWSKASQERDELRTQNQTFRNAQKCCEDCDAITVKEVKEMREQLAKISQPLRDETLTRLLKSKRRELTE